MFFPPNDHSRYMQMNSQWKYWYCVCLVNFKPLGAPFNFFETSFLTKLIYHMKYNFNTLLIWYIICFFYIIQHIEKNHTTQNTKASEHNQKMSQSTQNNYYFDTSKYCLACQIFGLSTRYIIYISRYKLLYTWIWMISW